MRTATAVVYHGHRNATCLDLAAALLRHLHDIEWLPAPLDPVQAKPSLPAGYGSFPK